MRPRLSLTAAFAAAILASGPSLSADPPKDPPKDQPKFDIDVPKDPLVGGSRPAAPSGVRVADVVDPAAFAIVQRAMKVAAGVRTLELVTSTRIEGGDPSKIPAGFGAPHSVTLEYRFKDAISLPKMRISPVASNGAVVFTHDGSGGLVVDNGAKVYRAAKSGWPGIAPFALPALPAWLTIERQAAASQGKKSSEMELRPQLVAASVLRTETVDGVECDVVRLIKSRDLFADDVGGGKSGVIDAQRLVFEIAYARTDGFPRRIVQFAETPAPGSQRTTVEFSQVRVNPTIDVRLFDAKPPEGYRDAAAIEQNPQSPAGNPAGSPAGSPSP